MPKLLFFMSLFTLFYFPAKQKCFASSLPLNKSSVIHQITNLLYKKIESKTGSNKDNGKKSSLLASSSTDSETPWSNAFNFEKSRGTQVDPRTGTLSAFIKAGSMISNLGHGPNINLQLNYSSDSTANPDGIAMGWSWNLTHFNPVTNALTTSTGKNFHLIQNSDGTWQPLYYKLKDILIQGNKTAGFTITYANGLREILNKEGYETRLEQQDGWGVNFLYDESGKHLLRAIKDDHGHKINISFNAGYIMVTSKGTYGQPVNMRINNNNAQLNDVSLPPAGSNTVANIHISYDNNRMIETDYPTGLTEKFKYDCDSAIRLPMAEGMSDRALCAVTTETVSASGQQDNIIHYGYTQANANRHDYLGFNSGLTLVNGSVKDILFEAPVDYTYQTTEDNDIIKEIRTYNKYHLMTDDKKISVGTGHILSEIQNFYCRTNKLNGCAQISFDDLPATYSLPLKTVTKLWGTASGKPDISTVTRTYDNHGHVISTSDSYGRVTKTAYCPIQGDTACPAEPEDWPFDNLPETVTVYPAKTSTETAPLLPKKTDYYYHKESDHTGHDYVLVLGNQIQQSGNQKTTIIKYYYDDPANLLTYGLIKKTTMTGTTQDALNAISKDYRYTESTDGHSRTIYKSIELSQGKSVSLPTVTTSLFTNQTLQKTDAAGINITRYHYDLLGRLTATDLAVGTPFSAHIYYQYTLSPSLNEVVITATDGLQHKLIMDSAGRQIMRFDEVISADGKKEPGKWWLKNKTTYDRYGRIITKYSYLADSSGNLHSLATTYYHDEMGAVNQIHHSDGETDIKQYNDPLRCMISYKTDSQGQRSPVSVVISNVLGKPVQQITLPATQNPLPSTQTLCENAATQPGAKVETTTYDGFGRVTKVADPMGRVTRRAYDVLGQTTCITDPSGNKIHYIYNLIGKIIQTWSLPRSGGKYLLASAQYNQAGELLWHAGEDGKRTTYTYTTDEELQTTTTPGGHIILLRYNVLNLLVARYVDGKLQLQTDYDTQTSLPVKKIDNTGVTTWSYTDDHLPQQETHKGKNGYPDYQLQWQYDQNRRIVSNTDIHGNKTFTKYDWLGRISALYYKNQILSVPVYDGFSRTVVTHYGSGMERTINYDGYNHPYQVKDTLNGRLLSQWSYIYDKDNNIIHINQQADKNETGSISYQYDRLNNLVAMRCGGSSGLPLCPRDTAFANSGLKNAPVITRQDYSFTPLNRIAKVYEVLQSIDSKQTLSKVMTYKYSDTNAPLRLKSISISWNKTTPLINNFSYDISGNMTLDGEGNRITYNAFNQIASVIKPEGTRSFYAYDGTGKEVMEKTPGNTYYLFYRGKALINESINIAHEQTTHTIGYYGIAHTIDGVINQYDERNYKGDITAVLTQTLKDHSHYQLNHRNIYSPYGMSWHNDSSSLHLQNWQEPLTGFNGERTDPATNWQFLGAGHRTYNPAQRYFVSEDPAGDGYRFGSNNPIMNTDPSGNMPKWLGKVFSISGDIATFGLAALHKKWANILGSAILAGVTVVSVAAAVSTYGGTLAVAAAAGAAAVFSSIPVVAAAIPANKGLSIAAKVSGGIAAGIAVATALPLIASSAASIGRSVINFFNGGKSAELASDLLAINPGLVVRRRFFRLFGEYVVAGSQQAGDIEKALLTARPEIPLLDLGDNIITFVRMSQASDRSVNLQAISDYLDELQRINSGSIINNDWFFTERANANDRLFSYIGRNSMTPRLFNRPNFLATRFTSGNSINNLKISTPTPTPEASFILDGW